MNFYTDLEKKIKEKNLVALSKAITLSESTRIEDNQIIDDILSKNTQQLHHSIVISISGIPGVGKSTFIESLGTYLHSLGKSIAVFAIDPSSEKTHGSILGDKTRMTELSALDNVFIRPSPSSNQLGGLGLNTHKNIEIAKLAGFDIILIETVGVGQSETLVKNLSDIFVLLLIPASGDELQGIKRGIMEVADVFIVNKSDGELIDKARKTMLEVQNAIHYTRTHDTFSDNILLYSSLLKTGIESVWTMIENFIQYQREHNIFDKKRIEQRLFWFEYEWKNRALAHIEKKYKENIALLKSKVKEGHTITRNEIDQLLS